jgi:hypothetical protein
VIEIAIDIAYRDTIIATLSKVFRPMPNYNPAVPADPSASDELKNSFKEQCRKRLEKILESAHMYKTVKFFIAYRDLLMNQNGTIATVVPKAIDIESDQPTAAEMEVEPAVESPPTDNPATHTNAVEPPATAEEMEVVTTTTTQC